MEHLVNLQIICFLISFIQGCYGCTFGWYRGICNPMWIIVGSVCGGIVVIAVIAYALMYCFCREKLPIRRYYTHRNRNRVCVNTMQPTTTSVHVAAHPPVQPPPYSYTNPLHPAYHQQQGYPQQPAYPPQQGYPQPPAYPPQPAYNNTTVIGLTQPANQTVYM